SPQAAHCLAEARTIVGYPLYVDLVPPAYLEGKTVLTTGMRHEMDRCNAAIDAALSGSRTAVVCSGDSGIYGMSGLVLELLEQRGLHPHVPLEIIPGIPAVCAAAALLGAPLMHDFACISLSDLLTPWESITARLHAAFSADFVVVLYNPRSRGRDWQLGHALDIARTYRGEETPVGIVRKAYRPDQSVSLSPLHTVAPDTVDMLSIVVIGKSSTRILGQYMLTPRGYPVKKS
ncbi:MAG: precorrin-3B C(17)-methyltransferase, partial [Desulfovibrionaceae bacterium]